MPAVPSRILRWASLCKRLAPAVGAAALAAWSSLACADDVLRVGSKRFSESYLLGAILTLTARDSGTKTEYREGLGNTAIVFEALKQGAIDLYPEYSGTVATEILHGAADQTSLAAINDGLRPFALGAGVPFGFDNSYALAIGEDFARSHSLTSIGDLAALPTLRLGLSHEFLGRTDGWPGLARAYGLSQTPTALDHGLAYQAIRTGQIDVIDAYTTDAKIVEYHLRVLQDNRRYFPRYDAIVLYRLEVPSRFPAAWRAIAALAGTIDDARMTAMNAEVELQRRSFAAVAEEVLPGHGGDFRPRPGLWSKVFGGDFWQLTWQHVRLVAASVALAVAVGVPLGVAAALFPVAGNVILAGTGVLQTIPALALLAMLIPVVGTIGSVPALIALFLYSLLPIVRNACTGVREVPAGMGLAALALGLSRWDRLRYVELPLAMPFILAGIKTAAVISVGMATIAAFIGAGGYGERISIGLALNDDQMLWAGAIPAALMAVATQTVFELIERLWRRRHSAG